LVLREAGLGLNPRRTAGLDAGHCEFEGWQAGLEKLWLKPCGRGIHFYRSYMGDDYMQY